MRSIAGIAAPPLALALVGCVPNPYYEPPRATEGGSTSTTGALTTDASASSTTLAATSDASTTGGTETDASTTGGACDDPLIAEVRGPDEVADAFFFHQSDGGNSPVCDIFELSDYQTVCEIVNGGGLEAVKLVRKQNGPEVMYAMRFDFGVEVEPLIQMGATIVDAELDLVFYDFSDAVTLEVGLLDSTQEWVPGESPGAPAKNGEANYWSRINGEPSEWPGKDGPRGASATLCAYNVPAGDYNGHPVVPVCTIGPESVDALLTGEGLVVSFPKDNAPAKNGPGLKATEAGMYSPSLKVRYCPP